MSTSTIQRPTTTVYNFCAVDPIDNDDLVAVTIARLVGAGDLEERTEILPRAVVESPRFQDAMAVARTSGADVTIAELDA